MTEIIELLAEILQLEHLNFQSFFTLGQIYDITQGKPNLLHV